MGVSPYIQTRPAHRKRKMSYGGHHDGRDRATGDVQTCMKEVALLRGRRDANINGGPTRGVHVHGPTRPPARRDGITDRQRHGVKEQRWHRRRERTPQGLHLLLGHQQDQPGKRSPDRRPRRREERGDGSVARTDADHSGERHRRQAGCCGPRMWGSFHLHEYDPIPAE